MRLAVVLVVLAACELQPPPKKQPAPVVVETTPPAPTPVAPADAGAAIDAEPVAIEATQPCITVGAHIADVFVQSATDPAQHAVYEQDRTKMVKATAEACTKQRWSDDAQKCYLAATTPETIKTCENKFPPPPPSPVIGSGSAAINAVRNEPHRGQINAGSGAGSAH